MRSLNRWLDYEPPGLCHTGIEEILGATALSSAAGAGAGLTGAAGVAAGGASAAAGASALAGGTGILSGIGSALPYVGTAASLAGGLITSNAQAEQADYANKVAKYEADAEKQKANADIAAGQQSAIMQDRKTQLVLSTARARSAASGGGGTTDQSDVVNAQNIAQQGEYNALTELYNGQTKAADATTQGAIDLFKGRQAEAALPYQQTGTMLSGIGQLANSYAFRRLSINSPAAAYYSGL